MRKAHWGSDQGAKEAWTKRGNRPSLRVPPRPSRLSSYLLKMEPHAREHDRDRPRALHQQH